MTDTILHTYRITKELQKIGNGQTVNITSFSIKCAHIKMNERGKLDLTDVYSILHFPQDKMKLPMLSETR